MCGKAHPVVFYVDNGLIDRNSFPVGHTLALLCPHRKTFLDGTKGIRLENTDFKVFKCPLTVLMDETRKIGMNRCHSCGKSKDSLLKCGKCMIVKYCDKECQVSHWKGHRSLCADMSVLMKLKQLLQAPFDDFVSFDQLKSDTFRVPLPTCQEITEPKPTAQSIVNTNDTQTPFILLFDLEEDLFFTCFGEKSSWGCGFQSLSEGCAKSALIAILKNPLVLAVIIQDVDGPHFKEIIEFYKSGGFVVYFGIYGEFDAPKKLSQAFNLKWTFSAYTKYEYELTSVGYELLGDTITDQQYSKSNLLQVPPEDRILVPKHNYPTVDDLIDDMYYDEDMDDEELIAKGRKEYDQIRERLNGQVPLAVHQDKDGGRIAYLGFVNGDGNIPKFVQAICKRVKTT